MQRFFASDRRISIALIVIMLLVLGAAAVQQSQPEYPPLATASPEPDGGKGLFLWLEELGYKPDVRTLTEFQLPAEADMILVLEPQGIITAEELEEFGRWVRAGGVLLIAGNTPVVTLAYEYFDFNARPIDADATAVQTPLFTSPVLTRPPIWETNGAIVSDRGDYVPLLTNGEEALLVAFSEGDGYVILGTSAYPFTNEGLLEGDNAALALNLAALIGEGGTIWFDEWHHGVRGMQTGLNSLSGPGEWLRYTAAGQSIIYILAVLFIAIVLSGRQFGRPVPLPDDGRRRAPLEYITAIANLNRRAGHRLAIQQQYRQQLKRKLAHRYRLNPNLPDEEYVQQLVAYNPAVDQKKLLALLQKLNRQNPSENELLEVAQEVNEWLERG